MSAPSLDTDNVAAYLEAATEHAEARVEYAKEWQRAYFMSKDSWAATQTAIEKTKDRTTMTAATLKVAEERMVRE